MARPERVMAAKMLMRQAGRPTAPDGDREADEGDHEFRGPPKGAAPGKRNGLPADPLRRAALKRTGRKLQRNTGR